MGTERPITLRSACVRHPERRAIAVCKDCARPLCSPCALEIPAIGTFCADCAGHRGGLHRRVTPRYDGAEAVVIEPTNQDRRDEMAWGIQQFEAAVADREPHPLISGLTERLEAAGADPEDVIDDDVVLDDIARLQEQASAPAQHRRWWHRS